MSDWEPFRLLGRSMIDYIADYYQGVESFPVRARVEPGYLKVRRGMTRTAGAAGIWMPCGCVATEWTSSLVVEVEGWTPCSLCLTATNCVPTLTDFWRLIYPCKGDMPYW